MQKPAILPVKPAHSRFALQRSPRCNTRAPLRYQFVEVLGMNLGSPIPALDFLQLSSQKIQPTLVEVVQVSVRPARVEQCGCRIGDKANALLRTLWVLDINAG